MPLCGGGVSVRVLVGLGEVDVVGEGGEQRAWIEALAAHDVHLDAEDDADGDDERPCQQAEDQGEDA